MEFDVLLWELSCWDFNINTIIGWDPILLYLTHDISIKTTAALGHRLQDEKLEKRCGLNSEAAWPSKVTDRNI